MKRWQIQQRLWCQEPQVSVFGQPGGGQGSKYVLWCEQWCERDNQKIICNSHLSPSAMQSLAITLRLWGLVASSFAWAALLALNLPSLKAVTHNPKSYCLYLYPEDMRNFQKLWTLWSETSMVWTQATKKIILPFWDQYYLLFLFDIYECLS